VTSSKRPARLAFGTLVAAILGVAIAALGMTAPAFAAGTGTISGTVTNPGNHGVANIYVTLSLSPTGTSNDANIVPIGDPSVTTSSGAYSFTGVPAGAVYQLAFNDNSVDYLPDTIYGVNVNTGATTTVNETMHFGGVVEGKVVDGSGNPINNVQIFGPGNTTGATTGSDGTFVLGEMPYGPQTIYINRDAYGAGSFDGDYTSTTVDIAKVSVDSGPSNVGTITITAPSTISGVVDGSDGKPLPHVYVEAYTKTANGEGDPLVTNVDGNSEGVSANTDGTFKLYGIPTGDVYLQFTPDIFNAADLGYSVQWLGGGHDLSSSIPIHVGTQGSALYQAARLTADGTITGTVTSAKGSALKGIPVSAQPLAAGSSTVVDQNATYEKGIGGYALTSSSGKFTIPGLPAGSYQLSYNTRSSGSALPADDTVNDSVYLPATGTLSHSQSIGQRTKVTGTLRGGSPAAGIEGATVQAYPYNTTSNTVGAAQGVFLSDSATTSSSGAYTLYLDPGTYVIQYTDNNDQFASAYLGGGVDPTTAQSTKLVVKSSALSGENATLLTAPGTLTATVEDSNGNVAASPPLGGIATLSRLNEQEGDPTSVYAVYDTVDAFPLTNLPDGSYSLSLSSTSDSYDPNLTSTPTIIDFTLSGGQLLEVGGVAKSGTDLGTIRLNPTTYTPDEHYTIDGTIPAINSTSDITIGQVLSAIPGEWTPTVSQFYYQWYRSGRAIAGATSADYEVRAADVGQQLSVGIFLTDPNGDSSNLVPNAVTPQTDVVQPGSFSYPSANPSISGTPKVASTLTAVPGTWSSAQLSFAYQWVSSVTGNPVVSTSATYKPVAADVGTSLTLRVTASEPGFNSITVDSAPVTIDYATAPKVTKSPKVTTVVTAGEPSFSVSSGSWSPSGTTETYLWKVYGSSNDVLAVTETGSTLTGAHLAERIEVVVTASKAGYADATDTILAQSGQTTLTGSPTLENAPKVGTAEDVNTSSLARTPSDSSLHFQWYDGTKKISGATSAQYTPVSADLGKSLHAQITAGASEYLTSPSITTDSQTVNAGGGFTTIGGPTFTGTVAIGHSVLVSPGVVVPSPSKTTYQWYRVPQVPGGGFGTAVKISGATGASYTPVTADLGDELQAKLTFSSSGLSSTSSTGTTTGTVAAIEPYNVTAPSIGATALVGSTLTANPGTWDVSSTTYTYQWMEDDAAITGATSSTYVVPSSALDDTIAVEIVAHRTGVPDSAQYSSNALVVQAGAAPVASAVPTLTVNGSKITKLELGQTIAASKGTWPSSVLAFQYQWQVNTGGGFTDISGADGNTLTLDATHDPTDFAIGYSYRVEVTGLRSGYADSAPAMSATVELKPV
jgi:hypothetical protein